MADRRAQPGRRESDHELARAKKRLVWAYAACGALFAALMAMLGVWWK